MLLSKRKSGGDLRLCVDYRALNANKVINGWLLPHIDDLLSQLKGAKVFSSLDLCDIIIRYQLILLIDIKQPLHAVISSVSIQLCHLGS